MTLRAKRIKREELNIKMFNEIMFGDPKYIDYFYNKANGIVYTKKLRGRGNWVTRGFIEQIYCEEDGNNYEEVLFKGFFAKDNELLEIISQSDLAVGNIENPKNSYSRIYDIATTNNKQLTINNNVIDIRFINDKSYGRVIEIYLSKSKKLIGLILEVRFGEDSYKESLRKCRILFN